MSVRESYRPGTSPRSTAVPGLMPATDFDPKQYTHTFSTGQTVWVRGLEDILNSLDADGKLDGLPFMPEMVVYCGQRFQVATLPQKTCVEGFGFRTLNGIVFLENLRCNGSAHGGCQRECRLFWHEAWLSDHPPAQSGNKSGKLQIANQTKLKTRTGERYVCQSTELAGATTEYRENPGLGNKFRRHFDEAQRRNMSLFQFVWRVLKAILRRLKPLIGMAPGHTVRGRLQKTESISLDLQPGDLIEVKSRKEIEDTLDVSGRNRGLLFDPPMLEYCGKRFRVANRLEKMILEETGRMIELKNTVVLENVTCQAWGCPRANLHFWREIWLKKIESGA